MIIITGLSGWRSSKYLLGSQCSGAGRVRPPPLGGRGGRSRDGSLQSWRRTARRGGVCDGHTGVQGGDQSLKPEPWLSTTMHPKSRVKKSMGQVPCDAAYLWNLKHIDTSELNYKTRNRLTENDLMLTGGESGGGVHWEPGINRYIRLYIK